MRKNNPEDDGDDGDGNDDDDGSGGGGDDGDDGSVDDDDNGDDGDGGVTESKLVPLAALQASRSRDKVLRQGIVTLFGKPAN